MWTPTRWNPIVVTVTITTTVISVVETSALPLPDPAPGQAESMLEFLHTPETMKLPIGHVLVDDPPPESIGTHMPRIRKTRATMRDSHDLASDPSGPSVPTAHAQWDWDAPLPVIPRSTDDTSDDACPVAVQILQRDYAGHGLPLTSLVIESSTFVLLAVFVVFFIRQRFVARRAQARIFGPGSTLNAPSLRSRNSILKQCPPSPVPPPSLTKIDEDPQSTSSHSSSHSQGSKLPPLPPVHVALSPQRGVPSSATPARSIFRSTSLTNLTASNPPRAENPNFLLLKH
ncbi:hypothetical protein FKP32DRAFT_414017 [Trametes sanguinea]|nr:hypothetical protein FKP32DRAFT_414017 [Trametes sanguinea]